MTLVVATFVTVCAVVVVIMSVGGAYVAVAPMLPAAQLADVWKIALLAAVIPFAWALGIAIGAIILIVPYVILATPMALAHRWLLLKLFGPAAPRAATLCADPPYPILPVTRPRSRGA